MLRIGAILFLFIYTSECRVWPNRDWGKWSKTQGIISAEVKSGRAQGPVPSSFDFYEGNIHVHAASELHVNDRMYGPDQIDIVDGRGFLLKGNFDQLPVDQSVEVELVLPEEPADICGMIMGSRNDFGEDRTAAVEIFWRSNMAMKWRQLVDTKTGDKKFNPNFETKDDLRVMFFDSVPGKFIKLKLYYKQGLRPSLRVTFLHSCFYPKTIFIADCGESIDNNPTYVPLPFGEPISIKCPVECNLKRPCWGYKYYTADSPVCWTAIQNFGQVGDGFHTLYKIPKAPYFMDQINPLLNNKIYCQRYNNPYAGYTFDRKYYDFAVDEAAKLKVV